MPRNKLKFQLKPCFGFFFACFLLTSVRLCAQEARWGGSLVTALSSDPKTFNGIVANDAYSSALTSMLFEGLTREDPVTLKVIPQLAKSWKITADGRQWTFFLREDLRWSDGFPCNAEDVVFTFQDLINNPEIPSSSKDVLTIDGKPLKVEALDRYTVRFTLPSAFAPFLRAMTQPIYPKHSLSKAVLSHQFLFTWGIDTPCAAIIGTGPFRLKEYHPGERLVLERNPYYWKKSASGRSLPYLDRVILLIIPDAQAQLLKFLDGELDLVGITGSEYPLLKPLERSKHFKIYEAGADQGSNFLVLNQNRGFNPRTHRAFVDPVKLSWFTNRDFRCALAHTMDKKRMIEILNNGLGVPQQGPMSPGSGFFYNPRVAVYDYNLDTARHLLAKAGFRYLKDTATLVDAQGNPVVFNLYTADSGDRQRAAMAGIIRADCEQLGIKVNLVSLEFNTLVNALMSSFDWDVVMIGLTGGVEPHFGQNVWRSSGGLHLWYPRQIKPATVWEKRIDTIFDQAVQELDDNKRKRLYDEFQYVVSEELPVIYTVLNIDMYAVRASLNNVKPSVNGGALHNIEEIYL